MKSFDTNFVPLPAEEPNSTSFPLNTNLFLRSRYVNPKFPNANCIASSKLISVPGGDHVKLILISANLLKYSKEIVPTNYRVVTNYLKKNRIIKPLIANHYSAV